MQGELISVTGRQKRFDRLYFGLFPDRATAEQIDEMAWRYQREHHIDNELLEAKRRHISMQHVGDYGHLREKFVFAAQCVGTSIALPAFDVVLEEIGSFAGHPTAPGTRPHRPLVLRARGDGLFVLFERLGRAMRRNGLRANIHFEPHLTLSYGPQMIQFEAITPIRFIARELVLIHSEVGLTRYHVLGHWPLH